MEQEIQWVIKYDSPFNGEAFLSTAQQMGVDLAGVIYANYKHGRVMFFRSFGQAQQVSSVLQAMGEPSAIDDYHP